MSNVLLRTLWVCACLFALSGYAIADSTSDKNKTYDAANYAEAERIARQLAEQGNAQAQKDLGLMYSNRKGVPQDFKEAVKWFRLAAEQGNIQAQHNLGVMYLLGKGVSQDHTETVKWFLMAAEQGDAQSQNDLGMMYFYGKGVPKNDVLAYMWLELSAANANGNEKRKLIKSSIIKNLSFEQFSQAKELAKKCTDNHFKECEKLFYLSQGSGDA